jgi:ferredoxin-NADP reductase
VFKAKKFTLIFHKKEKHFVDIYSFYFLAPLRFRYLPGQYLYMILPHEDADNDGSTRYFTIASSPSEDFVMITTRRTKSSFKKALFALEQGTEIFCFGPMGKFILPKYK